MRDLLGKLTAIDPDAGAVLSVIAYFDQLVESHVGLEPIIRGAAILSDAPALLYDDERRVRLRGVPSGQVTPAVSDPDSEWMSVPLWHGHSATLSLERPGPPGPLDAMVLERAAAAARGVLERTHRGPRTLDPAQFEILFDAAASENARSRAALRLGLRLDAPVRALATDYGPRVVAADDPVPARGRIGMGSAGSVLELPHSWAAACTALRFAAADTVDDPGPRVINADDLGGLAILAAAVGPDTEPIPDVRAFERARSTAPWMFQTLVAAATSSSIRAAATSLFIHHSTLQDRLGTAERVLGWSVRDQHGKLRLQIAVALWRLHKNRPTSIHVNADPNDRNYS